MMLNNLVTDNKSLYDVVKFMKDVYVRMNNSDNILLYDNKFTYKQYHQFFLLDGFFTGFDNILTEWLKGKYVYTPLTVLNEIRSIKKKSVISASYNDESFSITYMDKDDEIQTVKLINELPEDLESVLHKLKEFNSVEVIKSIELSPLDLESEILEVFDEDNKVFEIVKGRILPIFKEAKYVVEYSDIKEYRNVKFTGSNDVISLSQYFKTI